MINISKEEATNKKHSMKMETKSIFSQLMNPVARRARAPGSNARYQNRQKLESNKAQTKLEPKLNIIASQIPKSN